MRSKRVQLACATGGLIAPAVALAALFGTGVFPPQPAHHSAEQIAAFYRENGDLRMLGLFVGFCAIGLLGPLLAAITLQLLRIEGRQPIFTFLQVIAGSVTWAFLAIPLLMMFVAVYRAERSPEMTQTLHDLAWILFLIPIAPFIVQNLAIAGAIFSDDSADPVYPRWVAWANIFIGLSFVPDSLLGFFRVGPFAYQGVASFWIPTVTYGLWLNMMALMTRRAIKQAEREELAMEVGALVDESAPPTAQSLATA